MEIHSVNDTASQVTDAIKPKVDEYFIQSGQTTIPQQNTGQIP